MSMENQMNTFNIQVGQSTRKGNFNKLVDLVINSKNSISEIQTAYQRKYAGLVVSVKEITEVEIVELSEVKEIVKPKDVKSQVRSNEGYYASDNKYKATIHRDNIDNWNELMEPLVKAHNLFRKEENRFKESVLEQFNIKRADRFERKSDGVEFEFYNNAFDFKKTQSK